LRIPTQKCILTPSISLNLPNPPTFNEKRRFFYKKSKHWMRLASKIIFKNVSSVTLTSDFQFFIKYASL
jgi:hypothetical protein